MRSLTQRATPLRLLGLAASVALAGGLVCRLGPSPRLPAYLWIALIAGPLTISDLTERRLPNRIILPSFPVLLTLLSLAAIAEHTAAPLLRALLGALLTLTLYGIPYLVAPKAIGGGDVKLATLLSLPLAYTSWSALLTADTLTWAIAMTLILGLRCVCIRRTAMALAPMLFLGTLTAISM